MTAWRWGIVLASAMVLTSCTVKVPEVQVGGGGSSLEEQVVGSYESIGSSYDVISSRAVGGVVTRKPPTPEVRAAYARQRERLPQLEALKRSGAKNVYVGCVHPLFSGDATDRLSKVGIKELAVTNTIPIAGEKMRPFITVLSVGPLFAQAIKRIHVGDSVSKLFED